MKVIKHIIGWITNDVKVYYITGNHDEMFRKFVGFNINSFKIVNKVVLRLDGKKAWFFHGDVFDVTMQHSKWLTKLGAVGYDPLILLNNVVNRISKILGKGKISLSKKIKDSVKRAVKYINDFEETAADIAIDNKYNYVICGHIHQPKMRGYTNYKGKVEYLNSGDWVENLTALEYHKKQWSIYKYNEDHYCKDFNDEELEDLIEKSNKEIFNQMLVEFKMAK